MGCAGSKEEAPREKAVSYAPPAPAAPAYAPPARAPAAPPEYAPNAVVVAAPPPSAKPAKISAFGVHITVLRTFAADHPGLTTEDFCKKFIKPETNARQCAYIDLIRDKRTLSNKPYVAPATCFVSHAWRCKFADVVDCLVQHEGKFRDTYFWFDLLCNNQHDIDNNSKDFHWFCTTFKESIQEIGRVLIIMTPWDNPIPLRRAWCLFEMFSAVNVNADMHVGIPSSERTAFKAALDKDFRAIMEVLVKVDAANAMCSQEEDRQKIFNVIRTQISGGFDTLNSTVKNHLRQWYLDMCLELAEETDDPGFLYYTGAALRDFDNAASMRVFEKCLSLYEKADDETGVANACNVLGYSFSRSGDYDKALQFYGRCLPVYLRTNNEIGAGSTYDAMGLAHKAKGSLDVALDCFGKALDHLTKGGHQAVEGIYEHQGQVYLQQNNPSRSLECHQKQLETATRTQGPGHLYTANAHGCLGEVYLSMGDKTQALKSFQTNLRLKRGLIGEMHPTTALTYGKVGQLLEETGDVAGAREHFDIAYRAAKQNWGDSDVDAVRFQRDLKRVTF